MADTEEKDKKETEEKETEEKEQSDTSDNVVLAKFKKSQDKEDKHKKWRVIEEAVSAARCAYIGSWDSNKEEKTVPFDTAVKDLIEVLNKVLDGDVKLGGLGHDGPEMDLASEEY
ncbi:MAG: hypothetical protein UX50_C0013G0003 [Candidatus Beckwithbacteria bacterium GW2011_GWA1_46_30]|nr:MAG: hypothetical protein UX50_C0013G0003 [Candidatus Beckwithbacteria bacterium GW2011_GWA1_46_30]